MTQATKLDVEASLETAKKSFVTREEMVEAIEVDKVVLNPADAGQPEEKQPPAKTPKAPK